jgi:hypothetical protein
MQALVRSDSLSREHVARATDVAQSPVDRIIRESPEQDDCCPQRTALERVLMGAPPGVSRAGA